MKSTLLRIAWISLLIVIFIPHLTLAEIKTFIKEYTYQAGDEDSKNSCRVIALREVKRSLLEELGTYLESETVVKDFELTKDQITALTAGIVQIELIEEKWNTENLKYWLKARIVADSNEVTNSIDSLRNNRAKTKELEELRKRSDGLLKENERLRKELTTAEGEKRKNDSITYNKNIKDLNEAELFEKIYAMDVGVKEALSQLENQLQRRSNLIPNLVTTVMGYAGEKEKDVFMEVTNARAKVGDTGNIPDKVAANNELSGALSRLMVAAERYPDLKANQNFMMLQDELPRAENRIAVARMRYNQRVETYNKAVNMVPGSIIAAKEGFKEAAFFEAPKESKVTPKVKF